MNHKQRILTYVSAALFGLSLYFVPWRVQDRLGNHPKFGYEFSPYWRPVIFDEGGALRPVLLYVEWGVLSGNYAVLYFCLRNKERK
jgi:hypothetical protein